MSARYTGMNAATGRTLSDDAHIAQSVATILTTPLGTRLQRRDFGSLIPALIDRPLNSKTRMQVMAATVLALATWEPRLELSTVMLHISTGDQAGALTVDTTAARRDDAGRVVTLSTPLRSKP